MIRSPIIFNIYNNDICMKKDIESFLVLMENNTSIFFNTWKSYFKFKKVQGLSILQATQHSMRALLHSQAYRFSYKNFGKLSYDPFQKQALPQDPQHLKQAVDGIFQWAKSNGAKYYSFLAFPHTEAVAEKQQAFLGLEYEKHNLSHHIASQRLKLSDLLRGEADGSSFPNGGLRQTHMARGYFIWDWRSQLFISRNNNVLYIPSLLVNHHGEALDDKTTFRKAENFIEKECLGLLKTLGIDAKGIFIGLGLQQEFFVIPKQQYQKRLDLSQTGRTLFGLMSPHNQQLSDHYYGKLEPVIQKILTEAEDQLVEMGIPIKTRHKEVAPNQYQFCSVFEDASRAIDHNLIKMMIVEDACLRNGMVPLWHEKPFRKINGSGKHMNWSLNYYEGSNNNGRKGKLRNLFAPENYNDEIFLLFALIKLKAVLCNQELYLSSVGVPGNQLRLGGHEAPPRIFSAFLGDTVTNMIDKLPEHPRQNLKQKINHLITNMKQEDTDRNRTSPYAYTSNRFQFRAVGSSQNCYFPMTVILTTVAKEIQEAHKKIRNGMSVGQLVADLAKETAAIRFNGDGYSQKWVQEAKDRGLYINANFTENIENIKKFGNILVSTGVYSENQIQSKANISSQIYIKTVKIQAKTLLIMLNKNLIPRLYSLIHVLPKLTTSQTILRRSRKIQTILQKLIQETEYLEKNLLILEMTLLEAEKLRARIAEIGQLADEACSYLGNDANLPQIYDIFGKF